MSLGTDLAAAVSSITVDAALLRAVVQGPANPLDAASIVTLPSGALVKTLARIAQEMAGGHLPLAGGTVTGLAIFTGGVRAYGGGSVTTNVALGTSALGANTTGSYNTAFGYRALLSSTTAQYNVAIGADSLLSNTTGGANTAIGTGAMGANTTGASNVAVGMNALIAATTASNNTVVGATALSGVTTGGNNTAIGTLAGASLTTGVNNTIIGYNAQASAVGASNEATIGNSSIATLRCQATTITSLSDARDKKNVRPLNLGLDFLLAIEPKWFEWDMRPERDAAGNVILDGAGNPVVGKVDITEAGFIAQQLLEAVTAHAGSEEETGAEALGLVFDSNPDRLEATPGKLMPVFVKAFHDLAARVEALEAA